MNDIVNNVILRHEYIRASKVIRFIIYIILSSFGGNSLNGFEVTWLKIAFIVSSHDHIW